MRTLVASVLVGLDSLVSSVFSRGASSQYYLSGYKRWGQTGREFSVVCALSSWVGDSYLAEALADDRLARQWQVLYDSIADELMFIGTLPQDCWQVLASVSEVHVGELKHRILKATHTSAAYIWHKSLKVASEYPWRLCQGDVRQQLLHLKSLPEPTDATTTRKIHRLLHLGSNMAELEQAISLLADCPWSSSVCEQLHGSAATVHRFHRQLAANMLAARSLLHMARPLLMSAPEDLKIVKLEDKYEELVAKRVTTFGGEQMFFKDLLARFTAKRQRQGSDIQKAARLLMQRHHAKYSMLTPAQKRLYESRAEQLKEVRMQERMEAIAEAKAAWTIALHRFFFSFWEGPLGNPQC